MQNDSITDVLGFSMAQLAKRNEIIQNNIANAELPGFKKSAISFEAALQKELKKNGGKLENARQEIYAVQKDLSYRLDGNNVDIETEMTKLYETESKYATLAACVRNYYARFNLVLR
jgi:flagellar basal-body rod protein FlgB